MGRVLVVEDSPDALQLLEKVIQIEGHDVVACPNAENVFEMLSDTAPDLAIIDILLPGQHGVSLSWQLRNRWNELPIVIVSGNLIDWDEDDILDCGADQILQKPYDVQEMCQLLRVLLAEGREGAARLRKRNRLDSLSHRN